MTPERQVILLAVASQVDAARSRLTAHLAMADTIAMRPLEFSAEELMTCQSRVREALGEINAWASVFERETSAAPPRADAQGLRPLPDPSSTAGSR